MTTVNPLFNKKLIIYIYNSLLKESVSRWHFLQFEFFDGFMLFSTSSNGDLSNDTQFLKKNIFKQWLTVVKYNKIEKIYT